MATRTAPIGIWHGFHVANMLIELDGSGPKYQQLTRAIRKFIRDGELAPGARIPASRNLARQLACSRNVVLLAYEQLSAEGYVVSHRRGGTFVSPQIPAARLTLHSHKPAHASEQFCGLSPAGKRLVRASASARAVVRWSRKCAIDFIYGVCEPDAQLVMCLRRSFAKILRDRASFFYGDPAGDEGLRAEIALRLHATRGVRCSPGQIVVTSGAQQALDICARLILSAGDYVAVEDPGYEAARAVFTAVGANLVHIAIDRDGLNPAELPRLLNGVRLVYVTPSHQAPTGAILTAARRHALLAWARSEGAYVLEDDYDGELRFEGQRIRALAGSVSDGGVIYCGTFAKTLFPSLRLGYITLPEPLVHAVVSAKWLTDRGSPLLLQRLVQELMVSGEYDRHILRLRRRYGARHTALIRALHENLGPSVEVSGDEAGLHLVAWFPGLSITDVDSIVAGCRERGVGVYAVANHSIKQLTYGGIILGYGLLDEKAIETGVRKIAAVYRDLGFQTKAPNHGIVP